MGYVTCAEHGSRCCWRCDRCPKEDGFKLQKGDYCPDCVAKFKAEGYKYSSYFNDYVRPETIAKISGQTALEGL